jgi:hypothetical protein
MTKPTPTMLVGKPFNQASCSSIVGLNLPDNLSFEEWREAGFWLGRGANSIRWWVGDWLLYGHAKFGEMQAEVQDIAGLSYDSLADAKWIAKEFKISRRREKLSWGHHREVAGLPQEIQQKLLDVAEGENLNRSQLRDHVRTAKFNLEEQKKDARLASMTPEERERHARERSEQIKAEFNAAAAELKSSIASFGAPRPTIKPTIRLDDSGTGAAVPESLRTLRIDQGPNDDKTPAEAPPPIDRVAVAKAALDALSLEEATEVFSDRATMVKPASNVLSLGITPTSVPPTGSLVIAEEAAKSAIDTDKLVPRNLPASEISEKVTALRRGG